MIKLSAIIFSLAILSCSSKKTSTNSENKTETSNVTFPIQPLYIENSKDEGWGGDIKLSIISISKTDSATSYKAVSTYENHNVGLIVTIPLKKEESKGFGEGMILSSIGTESDLLLKVLARLYKIKTDSAAKFTHSVTINFVNLNKFIETLSKEDSTAPATETDYKIFFEGNSEDDYAELYLNINQEAHWIEIKEKDEDYRPGVLKALTQ